MSVLKLTSKSKILFYNQVTFFRSKVIFSKKITLNKLSYLSFSRLLLVHFFTYKLSINLVQQLLITKIVAINKSFLYFNTINKFTIVKPKFKFFFLGVSVESLIKKNILLSSNFSFLKFIKLKIFLKEFLIFTVKNYLQLPFILYFYNVSFFFKKIKIFTSQLIFYKFYKFILSITQKKINFLQFNIFFKNINICTLPFMNYLNKHAAIR